MPLLRMYSEIVKFQKQPNGHSKTEKAIISEIKNSMDRLNNKSKQTNKQNVILLNPKTNQYKNT